MAQQSMFHVASVYGAAVTDAQALTMTGETNSLGFTDAQIDVADVMRITVETGAIRTKDDGDAPEAGEGHLLAADADALVFGRAIIRATRFIAVSDDAGVNITLYSWSPQ